MKNIILYLMLILVVTACTSVPVDFPSEPEENELLETSSPLQPIEEDDSEPVEVPTDTMIAPVDGEIIPTPLKVPENIKVPQNRGAVYIDSLEILTTAAVPQLEVKGSLPTPCHQLIYNIAQPDAENLIEVEMYSVSDPEVMCVQVLAPFEEVLPLDNLPAGTFSVLVNGKLAGELQLAE